MDERRCDLFEAWMADVRGLRAPTIKSRLTNCRRVEKFEGDLDSLFELDRLADLLEKLTYSAEDQRNGRRSRHRVPIAAYHDVIRIVK
ncbi:MAG: hypothetical protein OXU77_00060 [Gammaproteobacteria bacterium]|nr:hypothetical protein [Gammaproteobacteria bacterium]